MVARIGLVKMRVSRICFKQLIKSFRAYDDAAYRIALAADVFSRAIPCLNALKSTGVATVLSTIVTILCFLATATIFSILGIAICGFERLSKNIARVLSSISFSRPFASSGSKIRASTPKRLKV